MKRSTLFTVGLFVLAGVIAASVPAAGGGRTERLGEGQWKAAGTAGGIVDRNEAGLEFKFGANLLFDFEFETFADPPQAIGTFNGEGTGLLVGGGVAEGQSVSITVFNEYLLVGDIGGTDSEPVMAGSMERSGAGFAEVAGQALPFEVGENSTFGPGPMEVKILKCREAQGDLVAGWNEQLQQGSWNATFTGSWTGIQQSGEPGVDTEVAQLTEDVRELVKDWHEAIGAGRTTKPENPDEPGEFPEASPANLSLFKDMATRAERLTNQLRNLDRCQAEQLGPDKVAQYFNVLTSMILGTVSVLPGQFSLGSSDIRSLLSVGLRSGALGSGSLLPAEASEAEEELRQEAQSIVDVHVSFEGEDVYGGSCDSANGCLDLTPELKSVLVMGAQQDWNFTINGKTKNARELVEKGTAAGIEFK